MQGLPGAFLRGCTASTRDVAGGLVAVCLVALATSPSRADVSLPPVFSDHMVLQRDVSLPVWGTAAAGERVTVTFRGVSATGVAGADGRWRVALGPFAAGGPDTLTVAAGTTIEVRDVLVGEVWVGSGQSNMQGSVAGYVKNDDRLAGFAAAAPYARIRLVKANAGWQQATPENVAAFSALLMSFGLQLQRDLDVPVGLMLGAVGGTPSGAWLSEEALAADAACQAQLAAYAATHDQLLQAYEETTLPRWRKDAEAARDEGKPEPKRPPPPDKPGLVRNQRAGFLYTAHIRPFIPFAIRGVLWDQGESGTGLGGVDQYTLMGGLIRGWRQEWGQGEFPFLYVQKPSGRGCCYDPANPTTSRAESFGPLPPLVPTDGGAVEMFVRIMRYPRTAMVITSDLGSGVHPLNKSGYGQRAADVALGMVYGRPVEYYGPLYASHAIEGAKVRVTYTHVGKGLATAHGRSLQGFAIAGADMKFHWADAAIEGEGVVVSSPRVPEPVAVRYAWAANRTWANLFNRDGLPAVPFRTDGDR
jgi:sialate O-acetylesterase